MSAETNTTCPLSSGVCACSLSLSLSLQCVLHTQGQGRHLVHLISRHGRRRTWPPGPDFDPNLILPVCRRFHLLNLDEDAMPPSSLCTAVVLLALAALVVVGGGLSSGCNIPKDPSHAVSVPYSVPYLVYRHCRLLKSMPLVTRTCTSRKKEQRPA